MKEREKTGRRAGGEKPLCLALAGNPNVGKSTVFNTLTGLNQHTGNWPGKTVTVAEGFCRGGREKIKLIDLPGCYSLQSDSPEEEVARDFILSGEADAVIAICDATCLARSLPLALQVIERCPKTVVALNLSEEARKKGITIDAARLSEELGVPVVPTEARSGKGLRRLLTEAAAAARSGEKGEVLPAATPAEDQVRRAAELVRLTAQHGEEGYSPRDRRLDRFFTRAATGVPVMLLLLAGVFWLTIAGANIFSDALGDWLMGMELPLYRGLCRWGLPLWTADLLAHGVYRVLAWVVSVMLPPMAIFFPLFTLLEDAGYLPRMAFNLDACFKKCRASGKQALTTG